MTLGKGLSGAYQPIAALALSGDIYDGDGEGQRPRRHLRPRLDVLRPSGRCRGGVAVRSQLMDERDLLGHVRAVMPVFERRLRSLA